MKNQNAQLIQQATQSLTRYSELSQKESLVLALNKIGRADLSIFYADKATPNHIATSVMKLAKAFPNMSVDFFNLLAERIDKRGISADRLEYAIDHVLDNFTYQRLTIADIMSLDRKVEIMTYSEMLAECGKRGCSTDEFAPIYIDNNEKPYWVSKVDKIRYKLPERL